MIPAGRHKDYPWPFSLIPRSFNAVADTHPPITLVGNGVIPKPGHVTIQVSKYGFYAAITLPNRWHLRLGTFRWDDVDHYYTFPTFTIKRLA